MPETKDANATANLLMAEYLGLRTHTAVSIVRDGRYAKCQQLITSTRAKWEGTLHKPTQVAKHVSAWLAQQFHGSEVEQALEYLMEAVPSITTNGERSSPAVLEELFFEASAKGEMASYYQRYPAIAAWCRSLATEVDAKLAAMQASPQDAAWLVYTTACMLDDYLLNERAKRIHERAKSHISIANGYCSRMVNAVLVQGSRAVAARTPGELQAFLEELARIQKLHIKSYIAKNADGFDVQLVKAAGVRDHFENVYQDVAALEQLKTTASSMGEGAEVTAGDDHVEFHGKQVVYSTILEDGRIATYFDDEAERRFRGLVLTDEDDTSTLAIRTSAGEVEVPGRNRFLQSIDHSGFISSCANDLAPIAPNDVSKEAAELAGLREINRVIVNFRVGIASILQQHEIVRLQLPNISEPVVIMESNDEAVIIAPGTTIDTLHAAFAAEGHVLDFIDDQDKFRELFTRHRLHANFPVAGFYLRKKKKPVPTVAEVSTPTSVPDRRTEISRLVHQESITYQRLANVLRTLECTEAPGGNGHTTWTNPYSRKKNSFRHSDTKCTGCAMPVSHVIDCLVHLALTDEQMQKLREQLQ